MRTKVIFKKLIERIVEERIFQKMDRNFYKLYNLGRCYSKVSTDNEVRVYVHIWVASKL